MSLRVFVQVWCEIDPTLNVRVDRQTSLPLVDPGDQLQRVSPLGRAGVAAALSLADASVTAFALGTGHTEALRYALAAGAAGAVELQVTGDNPDAISIAALAAWLQQQQADLVIADRLAGLVAARLGWAHLAGLDDLRVEQGMLRSLRFLGRGDREVVTAKLPACVRWQSESLNVPYLARARLQTVTARQIEQQILPGPEGTRVETGPWQAARPRTRMGKAPVAAASASGRLEALMGKVAPAAVTKRAEKSAATPEQLAEEFVRYLRHHNLLPGAG